MIIKKLSTIAGIVLILLLLVSMPALAASPFIKDTTNPRLLPLNAWESQGVGAASVIFDSGTYKMWYSGIDDNTIGQIGYATSPDGIWWAKNPLPVLSNGAMGDWDADIAGAPCVIWDEDEGQYEMWYTGMDSSEISRIGYATSPNGTTWTKQGIVLWEGLPNTWEELGVSLASVIKEDGTYNMWYTGRSEDPANPSSIVQLLAIGFADSPDGESWDKEDSNPILSRNVLSWDNRGVGGACVVIQPTGPKYAMYYTGFETGTGLLCEVGVAYSGDGIGWIKEGKILTAGFSGSWEEKGVGAPWVVIYDDLYRMWYTGTNNGFDPIAIGYATLEAPTAVPASSVTSILVITGGLAALIILVVLFRTKQNRRSSI